MLSSILNLRMQPLKFSLISRVPLGALSKKKMPTKLQRQIDNGSYSASLPGTEVPQFRPPSN
jgi:hypothetical protein